MFAYKVVSSVSSKRWFLWSLWSGIYMESTNISVWDVARSELNFETLLTRISWRFYPHLPALYLAKRNSGICANCPGMLLFLYLKWNQGNKLCQDDPGGLELWSLGTTQLLRVLLDFKKTNSFMSIHMEFFKWKQVFFIAFQNYPDG